MSSILYQRIKMLCTINNITITELENNLNFGASSIKKWETRSSPTADKLVKIADYFNVSTDYLLGRTDIQNGVIDFAKNENAILLLGMIQNLDKNSFERLIKMAQLMFDIKPTSANSKNGK